MFYKKFFTLFLCFIFVGQNLAQVAPKTEIKKNDLTPALQEKAIVLLTNLVREAEQFSLPFNRINARILVANLLWERDEKQARAVFQNAISELNQTIGQIPLENPDSDEEYNTERYVFLNDARNLRNELLLALGSRDPAFALSALHSLNRKNAEGSSIFEDDKSLELSLAAQIAEKDPKKAYELAKKNLEEGINHNVFSTLESLYEKDAELGIKLTQDIVGKIKGKDTKIISPNDYIGNTATNSATNMKVTANQSIGFTVNLWEVQTFFDTAKKLNQKAIKNKKTAVLTENEIKEIVDILAQIYVKQQHLSAYEVSKLMPEITKYFPAQAQAIRRKIGQSETSTLNSLISKQVFQNEAEDKSADEILQIIEKKPLDERDDLYWKAAETAYTNGDIEEAKKFHGKIKTKREYDYLAKGIENALPNALAEKGDLREVRQALAKLKTNEERIEVLTTLTVSVAKNGDKKTASTLLDEARSLYSGRMKNRKNLSSVLQIAQAFAVLEPEQSFVFLENNTTFFNDVIGAAILLDEFNESGAVQNEELRLDTVKSESYRNIPKAVALIKNLTAADFDRTLSAAEKFSRPEIRFFARYRIAEALLNPDAEEYEKNFEVNTEGDYHEH
ncbi:MAG: hypothetical protein LC768_15595 [Acidobacteria bacterium]|nr:hypothetical protein [Acidobacteriota bacterium]MCA1639724.1 hypothetical protein [Acidobacteriota bacterium]